MFDIGREVRLTDRGGLNCLGNKNAAEAQQCDSACNEYDAIEHGWAEAAPGGYAERDEAVPCEVGENVTKIEAKQAGDPKL